MSGLKTIHKRTAEDHEGEFRLLLAAKKIRPASLEDVHGTHHQRPLYRHPRTGQYYTTIK